MNSQISSGAGPPVFVTASSAVRSLIIPGRFLIFVYPYPCMLRRLMLSAITIIVVLYVMLIVLALFSDRLIFQPQRSSYSDAQILNLIQQDKLRHGSLADAQLVKLHSGAADHQHTITALYIPNQQARYTILFSHGNAEDIGDNLPFFEMLHRAGYAVFAYDYRGYGTSEGTPSERGVYEDIEAAYLHLTGELHVPPSRIISHGRSVGCGAAIHLAGSHPVAALIIESPFISAFRVLTRVPLLPFDKFNNLRSMRNVHVPVLVMHGRADNVIPFSHGKRIFDAANPPKQHLWVDRAGHNDLLLTAGPQYFQALQSFTASLPE
jgi:abhydrolase domain-containing protein 17